MDNIEFKTSAQARRYQFLKDKQARGEITDLKINVTFPLKVNGKLLNRFVVHFAYVEQGRQVTEAPAVRDNQYYNLKKELLLALYQVEIREI